MLEAALRAIAPRWALQRAQSRAALQALDGIRQRYEGGRVTRRTKDWMPQDATPEVLISADLSMLRARSRDLVRNNPYASAGLDIAVAYQVGTGIVPQSRTRDATLDAQANALWEAWAPRADGAGRHHVYGIQAQAARARAEAGEVLVLLRQMPAAEMRQRNVPVPLAVHVLEADHIDGTLGFRALDDGVVQGVRLDRWGRPLGYRFRVEHPGGELASWQTVEIPATNMLHLFRQDRPGQVRGVPDLAPVMTRLRMLDEYEDAALAQAIVQACVAAFVTSPAGAGAGPFETAAANADGSPAGGARGAHTRRVAPGMIERLLPGEDVEFLTPSGAGPFAEFARHQLRAVATGLGLTYDLITGDLSQANYSSLRAGRLAFKRRLEQLQWTLLVPGLCQPIWDAFVTAAQAVGALPPRSGPWPVEWAPPRFEMVDPLKDTAAIQQQLRLGLITWGQAVAEMGWDPQRQADEIAAWNENHDERGLILDGDSRRTARGGAAQDAAQNAAIEIAATGAATE
jgi:lambda family phage portal protein